MPHCLYVGTLTDLSGFFSPSKGAAEGGFFFLSSPSDDCLHGWLLSWLFIILAVAVRRPARFFLPFWNRRPIARSPMSYPQGYLYQPPGSLALYSCPAYGASALAAPRNEDLARSSSGSAFSPYPGSAAFSASAGAGFSSALSYSADPTTGFPSYMVKYPICLFLFDKKKIHVGVWKSRKKNVWAVFCRHAARLNSLLCFCYDSLISKCLRNFSIECYTVITSGLIERILAIKSLTPLA